MFSACIFCHGDLGTNEVVEQFPIGRRLAFDASKGRLWVVCKRCARWNLTPLEERWEAIETCERLFRDTRLRISTDNIGLARLKDGTDLVRVGGALRPEMAAWRYGEAFGKRRQRYHLVIGAGIVVAAGMQLGLGAAGMSVIGGNWAWQLVRGVYERATAVRVLLPESDRTIRVTTTGAKKVRLYLDPETEHVALTLNSRRKVHRFAGDQAIRHATKLLPKVNARGAKKSDVEDAVHVLERASMIDAPDLTRKVLHMHRERFARDANVGKASTALRLALEMSLHEDAERAAMEGELADLEDRWREAEEIAGISDDLFLPAGVTKALDRLRGR